MAAPHPSSVNPGSSEDEAQERLVLVKASMVYGLLEVNHRLIRQIQHSLKLYKDLENIYQQKVAQFQSLCQTGCKYGDALNRSDSNVQVLTDQLANVTDKLQSKDLELKKIGDEWKTAMSKLQDFNNAKEAAERNVEVKASIVHDLENTNQQLINQITICQEQTKALQDEIRDLRAVQEMLPKKVDTLTEAMDGIKETIFASGPMEESETNVNAEEDRGIQQNLGGMNEEVPLELEVGNQQRLKTKLCCHWEKISRCPVGDSCCFAHGNHELRPSIPNHRYKTKLCKSVTDGNDCSFGDGCHFAHSSEELRQAIRHPQD